MRFFITKKNLVWLIFLLCCVIFAIFLTGCGKSAGLRPPGPGAPGISGPGGTLSSLATWATWASGIGLLGCGVAAAFLPNKFQIAKLALGCFAALLTAGILHWVAAHWAILLGLCAGVLVLGGVGYVFLNRKILEKRLNCDLDQNGKIG